MNDISISLVGSNGDIIVLGDDVSEASYIIGRDVTGFGLTGLSVNIVDGAGDGGKYLSTRRLSRNVDLPIYTIADDRDGVETKLRRLGSILSGKVRIKATYDSGNEFWLDGYMVTGGDVTYGTDAGKDYAKWTIQITCPQPYWTSSFATTKTLTGAGIVSTSLTNNGDINAPIKLAVTGPLSSINFNNAFGNFTYEVPIVSGSTITIDCAEATVKNGSGANKYADLAAAPKMITVPKGTSTLNITATGIDPAAIVVISFYERREMIF